MFKTMFKTLVLNTCFKHANPVLEYFEAQFIHKLLSRSAWSYYLGARSGHEGFKKWLDTNVF
jgi:hypothetical protein